MIARMRLACGAFLVVVLGAACVGDPEPPRTERSSSTAARAALDEGNRYGGNGDGAKLLAFFTRETALSSDRDSRSHGALAFDIDR